MLLTSHLTGTYYLHGARPFEGQTAAASYHDATIDSGN